MQIESVIDRGEVLEAVIDGGTLQAIPRDPGNRHYAAILEWAEGGGVIEVAPGPDLEARKREEARAWAFTVNQFIERKPDGRTRYDQALKDNLALADRRALRAGVAPPQMVLDVETWVMAVQAHYMERLNALWAAADLEALAAIDTSYDGLEALFGVEGTEWPDPDVCTRDLL